MQNQIQYTVLHAYLVILQGLKGNSRKRAQPRSQNGDIDGTCERSLVGVAIHGKNTLHFRHSCW